MSKNKKKKIHKKTSGTDWLLSFQLSALIALELLGGATICKTIDKNNEIVKQELVNIKSRLEDKDLDIYTRVELHRQENVLTHYNASFQEYRQLRRQIVRNYRQNARVEKAR